MRGSRGGDFGILGILGMFRMFRMFRGAFLFDGQVLRQKVLPVFPLH